MNETSAKKTMPAEPEAVSEAAQSTTPEPKPNGRKWLRRILLVPLFPVLFIGGGWVYENTGRVISTENAYVKTNITPITSNVPGPVVEIAVQEHQHVKKGDLLFRITSKQYGYALNAAEAELAAARIEVEGLKSDYRQYGAELKEAKERILLNQLKVERQRILASKNFGRKALLEEAEYNLAAARQHESAIRENRRKALISLQGNPDLPIEEHPMVQEKAALKNRAATDLANTNIVAPADGIVSNVSLRVGEYVKAGTPIFSLVETSNMWIQANLKETQLTYIKEGQQAEFIADSYPDFVWPSRVDTISPATGAEFALLPAQNASGNWVKVVQRVPVRFAVTQKNGQPPLRAGMTVTVSIDTKRERKLVDLWHGLVDSYKDLQEKYFARKNSNPTTMSN